MADLQQLKAKLQNDKAIIGSERVLKELRAGSSLDAIYLASNAPPKVREDINHYAEIAGVEVVELDQDNEALGVFCKKNFFVGVVGTLA